jgi:phosphoribosylformylglycinamidine (FGAM) synthase-like enzyme
VYSLFSETQGRVVVTCADADAEALIESLLAHEVPYSVLGEVGGVDLVVEDKIAIPVGDLRAAWGPTLERLVHGETLQSEELREG